MEQLTKQVLIRLSESDYSLLEAQAAEQNRPVAWIARENLRENLRKSTE